MIETAAILLLLSSMGIILFLCLVVPILAILHCVENPNFKTTAARIIWIISIIFFWPFAAYIYYAFHARSTGIRVLSLVAILIILGGVGFSALIESKLALLLAAI